MSVSIRIDWEQLDVERIRRAFLRPRVLWASVAIELLKEVHKAFSGWANWARWAPLKPNTKAGRRAGGSSRPLQASGRLRASFRADWDDRGARVGSPVKIALYHHEGRRGPWTITPKRARALAFPVAMKTYGKGGKTIMGASLKERYGRSGRVGISAGGSMKFFGSQVGQTKIIKFKSYGHGKRSKKHLYTANMAVVMRVRHPGYPARPMLPPADRAIEIAQNVFGILVGGR